MALLVLDHTHQSELVDEGNHNNQEPGDIVLQFCVDAHPLISHLFPEHEQPIQLGNAVLTMQNAHLHSAPAVHLFVDQLLPQHLAD